MNYKMKDIISITGLPRTTIQKYFPQKNRKDVNDKTAWNFNKDELADLWLIRICFALGKKKDEILSFLKMNSEEKRKQLKNMINELQNYINEASIYIDIGVQPYQLLSKQEIDHIDYPIHNLYPIITDLYKIIWDSFIDIEDLCETNFIDEDYSRMANLLKRICSFQNKLDVFTIEVQTNIKELDVVLSKVVHEADDKRDVLNMIVGKFLNKQEIDYIMEAFDCYLRHKKTIQEKITELIESIDMENSCDISYDFSLSLIQGMLQLLYEELKLSGLKEKHVVLFMVKFKEFASSQNIIDKYINLFGKDAISIMLLLSKALETFIENNIEIREV